MSRLHRFVQYLKVKYCAFMVNSEKNKMHTRNVGVIKKDKRLYMYYFS